MVFFHQNSIATLGFLEIVFYVLVTFFFSILSLAKKRVSLKGIAFGNALALAIFLLGGTQSFFALAVFYLLGESATIYARNATNTVHEKRTVRNIAGNALAGTISLLFGFVPGFFGAMAAALSDTLSSEIGLLSKTKPLLITSGKPVAHGTNGGITGLGLLMVLCGSIVMSITYYFFFNDISVAVIVFFAGILGSTFDSLLGATLENRKIIGKSQVNFLATLFAAGFVAIVQVLI